MMKKLIAMMTTLMVVLFAFNSFAWNPPTSPAPASWISDPSGVLTPEAHARLDAKLRVINQSSANEVAALILPTLDGEDIADVGDKTAKAWGVGKKNLDNGVLVVLAMKEHKSRISTGKGVEGDLPDLKCNDILQSARPYLRKGDVEGALGFIFDSSSQAIANHKADVAAGRTSNGNNVACSTSAPGSSTDDTTTGLVVIALLGVGLWWIVSTVRRNRRREMEAQERWAEEMVAQENERLKKERAAALEKVVAERKQREAELNKPTPVVSVPVVPRNTTTHRPATTTPAHRPTIHISAADESLTAGYAASLAAEEETRKHRAEEERREREASDRRRREQEEEDRRRRDREREEEDRRRRDSESSSSSSGSSFDWGGGGSDSGGSGGFGGGDFGGGGSSGDW